MKAKTADHTISQTKRKSSENKTDDTPLRVVLNYDRNGDVFVYSDAGVEVIFRTVHIPDDVLYRYGQYPIPEGWLDGPIGFMGDGSEAEKRVRAFVKIAMEARGTIPKREPGRKAAKPKLRAIRASRETSTTRGRRRDGGSRSMRPPHHRI